MEIGVDQGETTETLAAAFEHVHIFDFQDRAASVKRKLGWRTFWNGAGYGEVVVQGNSHKLRDSYTCAAAIVSCCTSKPSPAPLSALVLLRPLQRVPIVVPHSILLLQLLSLLRLLQLAPPSQRTCGWHCNHPHCDSALLSAVHGATGDAATR